MRAILVGCGLALFSVVVASATELRDADPRLGRRIEDFALRDYRGAERALSDWSKSRLMVVAFVGTECPLARLYVPRLAQLSAEFAPRGVAFVGIDANRQDSNTELLHFARVHGVPFPILKDLSSVVVDRFGAERTPEVFLLDAERVIRYVGRIDDQYGVGYQRARPERRDLAEAIRELLADKRVSRPVTEVAGCRIGRARPANPASEVTWSKQIVRIVQEHCQACHRPGQIAPFPLLIYEEAAGWSEMIGEVVTQERMPPWHADPRYGHFKNDARLTAKEKELIAQWVRDGAPEGDADDLPPPRRFAEGWQIPKPDQIVYMTEEPFAVPAEGVVEYQWFEADPHFKEDKWIKAVECRPGNRAVVHHVTVYFKPPWQGWNLRLNNRINLFGGFAPGKQPIVMQNWDGTARYVPAGSTLMFEMHYTPNGTPQTDRSSVAFLFADPREVRRQLSIVMVANDRFEIPPHADRHRVNASYTFDEDSLLYSMSPHMHLRGKHFRFEATYPNGRREVLLDVPRFDFNWQFDYMLERPKHVAKGTRIDCIAHFDNSAANLANPDPSATVHWGDQTWDEMMIGTIAITPAGQDIKAGRGKPVVVGGALPSGRLAKWAILGAGATGLVAITVAIRRRLQRRERWPMG